jgi:hypothetical protein
MPEYAAWAAEQARAGNGRGLPQVSDPRFTETQSSIADPIAQGATFGFADELRGVVQGGLAAAQGGDFGSTYNQAVDESRNALQHERNVNPIGSVAAEVAGAIPTGMLAGGQLAGRGATLLGRAMTAGAVGAGQGAAYGAGSADDNKGAGAAFGAATGFGIGAALPVIGNKISQGLQRGKQGAILNAAAKSAPSADELKSAASAMFEQATGGNPIAVSDNAFMRFLGDVTGTAKRMRINEALDPKSVGLSEMMMSIADDLALGGTVVDMKDLHILRQAAQKVSMSSEGRDAAFANTVIGKLDDFIQTLKPSDVLGGADPKRAGNALMKGISTWSRANKVSIIEEAIRKGQGAASGPEKGVRNALRSLFNNKATWSRFSAAEQQAIKDVIDGTPGSNMLKLIGTFGFGGNTATNGIGGAAGMALGTMAGGPIGMIAGPAIGSLAKVGSERMTNKLAQRALGAAATEGLQSLPPLIGATPLEILMQRAGNPAQAAIINR